MLTRTRRRDADSCQTRTPRSSAAMSSTNCSPTEIRGRRRTARTQGVQRRTDIKTSLDPKIQVAAVRRRQHVIPAGQPGGTATDVIQPGPATCWPSRKPQLWRSPPARTTSPSPNTRRHHRDSRPASRPVPRSSSSLGRGLAQDGHLSTRTSRRLRRGRRTQQPIPGTTAGQCTSSLSYNPGRRWLPECG